MARISPFFQCDSPATARQSAAPGTPEWYSFHNDDRCPIGQEIKITGAWQGYEPTRTDPLPALHQAGPHLRMASWAT